MSQAFRLATTYQQGTLAIDRTAGVLRGITAMQAGIEALGHGVQADMQTLHLLAGMGNSDPDGIRTRFGHPGISENATGKKVANATDFRVQNDRLLHDSRLLQSARKSPVFSQDPIEYILEMAEKTPRELGESVVIAANTVWALDDGREIDVIVWAPGDYGYPAGPPEGVEMKNGRPVNATTPLPVLRPVDFHFVDFVGEPALVRDGLTPMEADAINYLFGGRASEYAQEMFRIVDEWRARYQVPLQAIPGKVDQIVTEYMAARSGRSTEMARKLKLQEAEAGQTLLPPIEYETDADPVEAALQEAEQATAQATEEPAESSELAEIEDRVLRLEDALARKDEQIRRMSDLLTKQAAKLEVLDRNIRRVDAEPIVTERVPKSKRQPLEDFDAAAYQQPAPRYQMATPTHVTDRRNGVVQTGDPAGDAMRLQIQMNREDRKRAGGR